MPDPTKQEFAAEALKKIEDNIVKIKHDLEAIVDPSANKKAAAAKILKNNEWLVRDLKSLQKEAKTDFSIDTFLFEKNLYQRIEEFNERVNSDLLEVAKLVNKHNNKTLFRIQPILSRNPNPVITSSLVDNPEVKVSPLPFDQMEKETSPAAIILKDYLKNTDPSATKPLIFRIVDSIDPAKPVTAYSIRESISPNEPAASRLFHDPASSDAQKIRDIKAEITNRSNEGAIHTWQIHADSTDPVAQDYCKLVAKACEELNIKCIDTNKKAVNSVPNAPPLNSPSIPNSGTVATLPTTRTPKTL